MSSGVFWFFNTDRTRSYTYTRFSEHRWSEIEYPLIHNDCSQALHCMKFVWRVIVPLAVSERDEVPKGDSKRVNTNQNAFLSCEAGWFGGSGDDYVWTKIGDSEYTKPMVPDPDHWLNDDKFTLGYLFFYNVSRGDNGTYECRLSNISGTVVDQKYLIVDGVPEVKIGFTKAVAFHGGIVNILVLHTRPIHHALP